MITRAQAIQFNVLSELTPVPVLKGEWVVTVMMDSIFGLKQAPASALAAVGEGVQTPGRAKGGLRKRCDGIRRQLRRALPDRSHDHFIEHPYQFGCVLV